MAEIKYWKTAIARKKPSLPLRLVLNELHGKILDYGCGRGTDVNYLKSLGYDVYGYDLYWSEWYHPELLTDNTYDVVLCFYVLNVVPPWDREKILENIRRILKPSGVAYFAVRDTSEVVKGTPYFDGVLTSSGTFQKLFTPDELEKLLRRYFGYVKILHKRQPLLAMVKKL